MRGKSSISMEADDKGLHCIHLLLNYVREKARAVITEPVPLSAVLCCNFIYGSACAMDCDMA